MPWYNQGTVDVTTNSDTVTGTGTAFSANVRVGDAFIGPDLGLYEVTNIASATVISIRPNYRGATVSGQSYAIAPIQGYVKESADRLRQLTDMFGSNPFLQASTPEEARAAIGASQVGDALFTAISALAARQSLGSTALGDSLFTAADQIAALTALGFSDIGRQFAAATTASEAREAIGANDAASLTAGSLDAARIPATLSADKAFRRGNILGVVSQLAGVPTGAIQQVIVTASGLTFRFAGGMQVCVRPSLDITYVSSGRLEGTWTYPSEFASGQVSAFLAMTGVLDFAKCQGLPKVLTGATSATVGFRSPSSTFAAGDITQVCIIAIGRWFE